MNATDELTPAQAREIQARLDDLGRTIDRTAAQAKHLPAAIRKSVSELHRAVCRSAASAFQKAADFADGVAGDEDATEHHEAAGEIKSLCDQHAKAMLALHEQLAQAGVADGADEFAVNSTRPTRTKSAGACSCGGHGGTACTCRGGVCRCEPGHKCNACFRPGPGEIALLHDGSGSRMVFSGRKELDGWLKSWATTPAFAESWLAQARLIQG